MPFMRKTLLFIHKNQSGLCIRFQENIFKDEILFIQNGVNVTHLLLRI